jgi:hypothetical protein
MSQDNTVLPSTEYFLSMFDDFGMWQHANGKVIAREHGYALDDVARGLIVCLRYNLLVQAKVCMNYLEVSVQGDKLVGFFDEHRQVVSTPSSEDAHGLALWALAEAAKQGFDALRASTLYHHLADTIVGVPFLRPHVYGLIAASLIGDDDRATAHEAHLLKTYNDKSRWYEDTLYYANGAIPYALLLRYQKTKDKNLLVVAADNLALLNDEQQIGNHPAPVSNDWPKLGAARLSPYGQQPIEAGFMVMAWSLYADITLDDKSERQVAYWMSWFHGNNISEVSMVDPDGACHDGLESFGPNPNCGAESTIMYLLAANENFKI